MAEALMDRRQFIKAGVAGTLVSGAGLACSKNTPKTARGGLAGDGGGGAGGGGRGGGGGSGGGGPSGGAPDANRAADADPQTGGSSGSDANAARATDGTAADAVAAAKTIIDTHIHLTPLTTQSIASYDGMASALGVSGCLVVEANWTRADLVVGLQLAMDNRIVVGVVGGGLGNPGSAGFQANLEMFAQNRLLRGIRLGNVPSGAAALADLEMMAAKGVALDIYNIQVTALPQVAQLAQAVPKLTIVLDHMGSFGDFANPTSPDWVKGLQANAARPNVYLKMSWGSPSTETTYGSDVEAYRKAYDQAFGAFGEDRVFLGTNWPVVAQVKEELAVDTAYFAAKGPAVAEKFFRRNSQTAYRWIARQ